jgi:hypothetical protein
MLGHRRRKDAAMTRSSQSLAGPLMTLALWLGAFLWMVVRFG